MVLRLEPLRREVPGRPHVLEDGERILIPDRHTGLHDVRQLQGDGPQRNLGVPLLRLRGLHLGRELLGPGQQRLPLVALRPSDVLAQRLLLGPHGVVGQDRLATPFVGGQHGVDHCGVLTTGALRLPNGVGVVAKPA